MIPDVEEILRLLLIGSITMEQAVEWIDTHLSCAYGAGHSAAYEAVRAEESEDPPLDDYYPGY